MKKIVCFVLICTIIIITQTGCGTKEPVSQTGYYLDTTCTISVGDMDEDEAKELIKESFALCKEYENIFSKTVKGSDIWKLNRAKGKAIAVSRDTVNVIKKGIYFGEISKGAFDITIGRVTDLWDFKAEKPVPPSEKKIKEALKTVDYRKITIKGDEVRLDDPGSRLDLGGIAKGYIADRLSADLIKKGVKTGIVNLGGNIVTIGEKSKGTPWKIGIERPYTDRKEIVGALEMKDQTVVTSGIYERTFKYKGKDYHHVIDPNTGYPAESDVESVTIKSGLGKSVDCDGLSTVCLMIGEKRGKALIEKKAGFEALFIDKNDKITKTKGMNFEPEK